jgi:hypothetical protein
VAADVLSADSGDASNALALTEASEKNAGLPVQQTIGDCAYGGGPTRKAFAEAERELLARVPAEWSRDGLYPKSAFIIDLEQCTVQCPAGHVSRVSSATKDGGRKFFFGRLCDSCPLRSACTKALKGRTLQVHTQEALLRAARSYQATPSGRHILRTRVVVEHRLARLGQLGIGQARYFGQCKVRFQLLVAATIANLRRTWNWRQTRAASSSAPDTDHQRVTTLTRSYLGVLTIIIRLLAPLAPRSRFPMQSGVPTITLARITAFRPGF